MRLLGGRVHVETLEGRVLLEGSIAWSLNFDSNTGGDSPTAYYAGEGEVVPVALTRHAPPGGRKNPQIASSSGPQGGGMLGLTPRNSGSWSDQAGYMVNSLTSGSIGGDGSFTVEAVVRESSYTSTPLGIQDIVGNRGLAKANQLSVDLDLRNRGGINAVLRGPGTIGIQKISAPSGTVPLGEWVHIAVVYTASSGGSANLALYVNGVMSSSTSFTGAAAKPLPLNRWGFGMAANSSCGNRTFNGQIDAVTISNMALTPEQFTLPHVAWKLQGDGHTANAALTPQQLNLLPVIDGVTNAPTTNSYVQNAPASITFSVQNLDPQDKSETLHVQMTDALKVTTYFDQTYSITPNSAGQWTKTVTAPTSALGLYYVTANTSSGVGLPAVGSRPAGFMTYMVSVDPASRPDVGEATNFGMQGGWNANFNAIAYLGVGSTLSGCYNWANNEPASAGQYNGSTAPRPPADISSAVIFGDLYRPPTWATGKYGAAALSKAQGYGALKNSAAATAWGNYCTQVGIAAGRHYPNATQHVYQLLWEPVNPWHFDGTPADLVQIYQIGYAKLHAADPKAWVIGPAYNDIHTDSQTWLASMLQAGLGNYLDAVSIHPYCLESNSPETMSPDLRTLIQQQRSVIYNGTGKNLDLWGTEQGWKDNNELNNALYQTRTSLIMLGEGFKANYAFYIHDIPENGTWSYGYYYNLNTAITYGTNTVGPKPVAAAYAAMTYLLEGYRPVKAITDLGGSTLGYAYKQTSNGNNVRLALWSYGADRAVSVNVGVSSVTVYDWMGNPSTVSTPGGVLNITLTSAPKYIAGVAVPAIASVQVNDSSAQRSMVNSATVVFNEPVTLSAGAIVLQRHGGGAVANVNVATPTNPSGDGRTYVVTFWGTAVVGASLPDGVYDLVVKAGLVQDRWGNALASDSTFAFHRLFGDYDGNGTVNSVDYARLTNAFGAKQGTATYLSLFDYDGNGVINSADYAQFTRRFNVRLVY
jgi:hypothetical protein